MVLSGELSSLDEGWVVTIFKLYIIDLIEYFPEKNVATYLNVYM